MVVPKKRVRGHCSVFLAVLAFAVLSSAGIVYPEPSAHPYSACGQWPPAGEKMVFQFDRDTSLSSVKGERFGSNGGASRIKLKGQQEIVLFDFDVSSLKQERITGALLHVRSAEPEKAPLGRVGISTISSDWVEGKGKRYREVRNASCFEQAQLGSRDWSGPDSTIMDVTFGRGGSIWKFSDCSPPDSDGWQTCAVDPDVIAARISGLSRGFAIYDEIGTEWSLADGEYEIDWFPNRIFYSRERRKSAPWVEIWVDEEDTMPPTGIDRIVVEKEPLPSGEALVRWATPPDTGGGKTLGFFVSYKTKGGEEKLPASLVPMAGQTGEDVFMHLRDLPEGVGPEIELIVRAVDNAGNIGSPYSQKIHLSEKMELNSLAEPKAAPFPGNGQLPVVGGVQVAVLDLLDKVESQSGMMIPGQSSGYVGGNHIYSARDKLIRLQAARNETIVFQVNLQGEAEKVALNLTFPEQHALETKIFKAAYVPMRMKNGRKQYFPDPLLPQNPSPAISSADALTEKGEKNNVSFFCELYAPHGELPGEKRGQLIIEANGETLVLEVALTVWDFTLPDTLSFLPEMNAYGSVNPFKNDAYGYYRLAHAHRTCINSLPYGWDGRVAFGPKWDGREFDWHKWDKRVGPLLDGSAFADLPRKSVPVDVMYLPINENWPVEVDPHYSPSYWIDEAMSEGYREQLERAFAALARHLAEKDWNDTEFQFYLNNKVSYRQKYSRTSAYWSFDEPVNTQDFWALRWYGLLWQKAVQKYKDNTRLHFRVDVSYGQFSRDLLLGVADMEYIGGMNSQKAEMKREENILTGGRSRFREYGSPNRIDESNVYPVLWCISAWCRGADGVLPWQTVGKKKSWREADRTALFYPSPNGPIPSLRLKAFTRGQQDVEYAHLLAEAFGVPEFVVSSWLQDQLKIHHHSGKENRSSRPGRPSSSSPSATIDLWKMRQIIGETLSQLSFRHNGVAQEKNPQHNNSIPRLNYVAYGPDWPSRKPKVH